MSATISLETENNNKTERYTYTRDTQEEVFSVLREQIIELGLQNQLVSFCIWTSEKPSLRVLELHPNGRITGSLTDTVIDVAV